MILWVGEVARDDEQWEMFRALLQVLPLEPRRILQGARRHPESFLESAGELLARPRSREGAKGSTPDFFTFRVVCGSYVTAIGRIHHDESEQIEEFLDVVGAALESDLTHAMRRKWVLQAQGIRLKAEGADPTLVQRTLEASAYQECLAGVYIEKARSTLLNRAGLADSEQFRVVRNDELVEEMRLLGQIKLQEDLSRLRAVQQADAGAG